MTTIDIAPSFSDDAIVVADTTDMDRAEWLDLRTYGIGGSDAAAICGQSRYTSPLEVYLEKVGAPEYDPEEAGEAALWGNLLEPIVRDRVAIRKGVEIDPCKLLLSHRNRPWQLANIDGDVPELDAIYEGKTASVYLADEWADDNVPDAYMLQGLHYLAVTGRARVLFGVLIGGQRLETRIVERDQELIDHLISLEAEFWAMVQDRRPPAPDGSKACTELLSHLWSAKPGAVRTLDPSEVDEVQNLIALRGEWASTEKAAAAHKAEVENQLKVMCEEHEVLATGNGRALFTWKEQTRRGFDAAALKAADAATHARYETSTTFRKIHFPKQKAA